MGSLGSFGAAVREFDPAAEKDTFDLFGETFTVHDTVPPMLMLQLGAAMTGKIGRFQSNGAVWQIFESALSIPEHQEDGKTVPADNSQFAKFHELAVRKRCDNDTLIDLVWSIIAAQAGKAEEQQPTSPPGSGTGSTSSSSSASGSPDSPRLRPVDEVLGGLPT